MPTPKTAATRRYDAVICDIDGCLGPEKSDPLNAELLSRVAAYNTLAYERQDRPIVTVCSGRPQPFAEAMCRLIGNTTLPAICEMGVWLWWPAENRFDRDPAISPEHLHAVHEAVEWVETELGPKGVVQQPGKTCSTSLYHDDTAYLKSLEPTLRDLVAERNWPLRVSSTWLWINIDLAHVSKATGIERMMVGTGLNRDRLAGIGDTIGDRAIRDHVAFFACPANATDEIKAHADHVSPHEEAEGVLEILDTLIG
jgi:hydroxymethylpyrimidine pyrophosphatase-like HAD family hydrolase